MERRSFFGALAAILATPKALFAEKAPVVKGVTKEFVAPFDITRAMVEDDKMYIFCSARTNADLAEKITPGKIWWVDDNISIARFNPDITTHHTRRI